ncbi:MAG: hypothetical protein CMG74_03365 [Candidatus Marinimicrobia bacterium]|nr:hypothetical protein [Candidatus Neomarinimicrobiota bacterium]
MINKKILFIHPGLSTFVRNDLEFIKREFSSKQFHYHSSSSFIRNLFEQIRLIFWFTYNIWWCDYVYIWFSDYHSFFPILISKLLKKKSFIVIGGYEVSYFYKIGYGSRSNPFRFFLTKYSIKNASLNLPVSKFVDVEMKKMYGNVESAVIYNGVNCAKNYSKIKNRKGFLTVAIFDDDQRYKLKGIDLFIETASYFPNEEFVIIGCDKNFIRNIHYPENVTIYPKVSPDELSRFYLEAKYYCQFSLVESFGLAVVEAMSYGCIPIVVDRGALKEIIQGHGIILQNRSINDIIENIKLIINKKFDTNSIVQHTSKFSLEIRNTIQRKIMVG